MIVGRKTTRKKKNTKLNTISHLTEHLKSVKNADMIMICQQDRIFTSFKFNFIFYFKIGTCTELPLWEFHIDSIWSTQGTWAWPCCHSSDWLSWEHRNCQGFCTEESLHCWCQSRVDCSWYCQLPQLVCVFISCDRKLLQDSCECSEWGCHTCRR